MFRMVFWVITCTLLLLLLLLLLLHRYDKAADEMKTRSHIASSVKVLLHTLI